MKSSDFLIRHECPQCGAPATLAETDRVFQCGYCKVRSCLLQKDFFRYVIPHNAEDQDILYVPYWRFRGSVFSCFSDGIRERFTDLSHLAIESSYFPLSLGFRSQALKLQFLSPETTGHFLKPTLPFETAANCFNEESSTKPLLYQEFIGETVSMIYAPFYLKEEKLYDAVLNKPYPITPVSFEKEKESKPDWRIRFIAALCPNCGWDLQGERNSLTLHCLNCNCIWHTGEQCLTKPDFAAMPATWEDAAWLPFWRIRADVSEIRLDSYADMIRLANLPKIASKEEDNMPFYFWMPAFKVQPQSFLRFAHNMTVYQPQDELAHELPKGTIYPVTLPDTQAIQSLKIHLAGFIKPKKTLEEKLGEIRITHRQSLLVYVPFQNTHHELIQPDIIMSVHKNLLAAAKNL